MSDNGEHLRADPPPRDQLAQPTDWRSERRSGRMRPAVRTPGAGGAAGGTMAGPARTLGRWPLGRGLGLAAVLCGALLARGTDPAALAQSDCSAPPAPGVNWSGCQLGPLF